MANQPVGETSSTRIAYEKEVEWGTPPGGNLQILRMTGETLEGNKETLQAEEIAGDPQVLDVRGVGYSSGGGLNYRLSHGTYDDWILASIRATAYGTPVDISGADIGASNTNSSFTSTTTDFTTQNIQVGQYLRVAGFTGSNGQNNGLYLVRAVAANELTVSPAPVADEAAGDTVTMKGAGATNGSARTSFTIEKQHTDLTNVYRVYPGSRLDQWAMSVAPSSFIEGSFTLVGSKEDTPTSSVGSGYTPATTTDLMNCVGDIRTLLENHATIGGVTGLDVQVAANARQQQQVGSDLLYGIGLGDVVVTGTLNVYLTDASFLQKFAADTATSISFAAEDQAGNAFGIYLPRVRYGAAPAPSPGNNQDVIQALSYTAMRDPTLGYTIMVTQMAA